MRYGIIDLGTNTFNLLIAERQGAEIKLLFKKKLAVKLGSGSFESGKIQPEAMQRGFQAIREHKQKAASYNLDGLYAIATSALRSSSNAAEFVSACADKMNIHINIISGDEEAQLIYEGVAFEGGLKEEKSLIMDIGGGSTEFIIADNKQVYWKKSFDLGAARLLSWLSPMDPIADTEIRSLLEHLRDELQELWKAIKEHQVVEILGSSGSFETLARMLAIAVEGKEKSEQQLKGYNFPMSDYHQLRDKILASTLHERLAMPGMLAMRADMIVMSALLIESVQQNTGVESIRLSNAALKEGVFARILQNKITWQRSLS